jgi:PncC family amidohydrolase
MKKEIAGFILGRKLTGCGKTLSTAESCTGGLLSHKITQVPGSSNYFNGGIIAYSNESKIKILKVRKSTIGKYGAVSKQCAVEMAENARKLFKTDYGISVTGIAGPAGASRNKPVGLVYFGISSSEETFCFKKEFTGSRAEIKNQSANFALDVLIKKIK